MFKEQIEEQIVSSISSQSVDMIGFNRVVPKRVGGKGNESRSPIKTLKICKCFHTIQI